MHTFKGLLVGLAIAASLLTVHAVRGDVRRVIPERRPYIVELGEPYSISNDTLAHEARKNSDMRGYLDLYGWPDYAEIQELMPVWPWESYEVRLYYMRRDLEVDFSHIPVSRALTDYGILRYQGMITPEKRHEIEVILEARLAPPPAPPAAASSPETTSEPAPPQMTD